MSKLKKNIDQPTPPPTVSRMEGNQMKSSNTEVADVNLMFGKKNFMYILGGFGLILLGMLLMSGGHMTSPDVWDESIIYSSTRTLLAPIVILSGLVLQVFAIFSKKD